VTRTAAAGPALLAAAALAVALAGCGEKRTTTTSGASGSGSAPAAVSISESEFKLDPSSPQVSKTGPVTFQVKNAGATTHALAVVGPGGVVKTAPIAPGKSATLQVDISKAGTYQMYCPIDGHRGMGMNGAIKVGSGGSGGGTSTGGSSSGGGGRSYGGGGGY
jgi:uncharacterized cupredoxin-like copper-binding protein